MNFEISQKCLDKIRENKKGQTKLVRVEGSPAMKIKLEEEVLNLEILKSKLIRKIKKLLDYHNIIVRSKIKIVII